LSGISFGGKDRIVLDLYGNLAYKFEQFDGTLSLAYKSSGRYHLAGNVVVCPVTIFKKTLENTGSLFLAKKNSTLVVVPPLPRYLFAGCCKQADHCANVTKPEHASKILSDAIGLRNSLKKFVPGLGLSNCRVLDTCCVTDCIPPANVDNRIEALRAVTAKDGVHFSDIGYDRMVKHIMQIPAKPHIATSVRSTSGTAKVHYWRGFRSPVGSTANVNNSRSTVQGRGAHARGGLHRGTRHHNPYHPYRRHLH
jgi:hypothetical protein